MLKDMTQFLNNKTNSEINVADSKKYRNEIEDDTGAIQQISGGFGDSQNLDENTIKILLQ